MQSEGTSLKDFIVVDKLGTGSFSSVYKVQRIDDKNYYAMKKVKINQMKEKEKQNALNQVRILASITHPNIINYREAFFDDKTQTLCVVMQLADAGDIQKKINQHQKDKTHFNEVQIWQAFIQMTKGLKALHQINILHRDLKCANVFCTNDGKYKLGDLNVSKVAKRGMARTQTGTPYYTSPEVWNDKPYDSKCDIWSLACVVYEMATLQPPFRASTLKQLYTKIQKGIYPNIPAFYSEDLRFIISQCLKVNPVARPSANEILQHERVLRNLPASQKYSVQNNQTSKAALLKTILVPRNMKNLKQHLPCSKYQNQSLQKKYRRANSAQNLRKQQIPRVITTPKVDQQKKYDLKYALMKRPSQNIFQEPKSQIRELSKNNSLVKNQISDRGINSRMQRNNSVDYIRRRVDSNQSIDGSRRRDSVSKEKVKVCMQDISNRCKQIQERVKNLMNKKKDMQQQRNPNLPIVQKKYHIQKLPSYLSNQRPRSRDGSVLSNRSRNNSVSKNNSIVRNNSYKSIQMQKKEVYEKQKYRKISNQKRLGSRQQKLPSLQKKELVNKIAPNNNIINRNYFNRVPPRYNGK